MYLHDAALKAIASSLNEEGITTKRGSSWTIKSIKRVLMNEIYIGSYSWNRNHRNRDGKRPLREKEIVRVRGAFPAIIDEAIFFEIQRRLKSQGCNSDANEHQTMESE